MLTITLYAPFTTDLSTLYLNLPIYFQSKKSEKGNKKIRNIKIAELPDEQPHTQLKHSHHQIHTITHMVN